MQRHFLTSVFVSDFVGFSADLLHKSFKKIHSYCYDIDETVLKKVSGRPVLKTQAGSLTLCLI